MILFDNKLVVYKQAVDVTMYVVGSAEENEIMLYLVVVAIRDCLDALLKYIIPRREKFNLLAIQWINERSSKITTWWPFVLMRFVMMGMSSKESDKSELISVGLFWKQMLRIFARE